MAVTLTVSQVRDALFLGERTDKSSPDSPTTPVLGQWFHEGLSLLVADSSPEGPLAMLADVDAALPAWKETLRHALYERFVGPRLTRHQAGLHESAVQVLNFWLAMEAACDWVADLCWSLRPERPTRRAKISSPWETLAEFIQADEVLTCEFKEPGWSDGVRLVGIADAIVRLSTTGAWCVVEFKSGQTSPAADLGQACLYHMILSTLDGPAVERSKSPGALAVINFRPERQEILFSDEQLAGARQRLLELIGRLAGVSGSSSGHQPPVSHNVSGLRTVANEYSEMGLQIVKTFDEYGVNILLDDPIIAGPAFLRFPVILGKGTTVTSVTRRAAEVQVRLGLMEEPFISRDAGRLVIDVQRPDRQTVSFDDVRGDLPGPDPATGRALVPIGVDLAGELVCADMSRPEHAHLLAAGTTGSGKSEWLRAAVAGLIVTNTPQTLKLVIIDPKRNAFHALRKSPYLWQPIIFPDERPAAEVLELLCEEMDARYRILEGADTVADLAARSRQPLPRIVCICDEYRDLITRSPKERKLIEDQICRLGAKARAAGIHLILATQQPSRETVRGPLDSNMPARVALKMEKRLESQMLLGEAGAEKLLGHGDLLFKDIGSPRRLQAPLLTAANRREIFGVD